VVVTSVETASPHFRTVTEFNCENFSKFGLWGQDLKPEHPKQECYTIGWDFRRWLLNYWRWQFNPIWCQR